MNPVLKQIFLLAVLVLPSLLVVAQPVNEFVAEGQLKYKAGKNKKAIKLYDRAIEEDSTLVEAHYGKGAALMAMGYDKFEEKYFRDAIASLTMAIALDSTHALSYESRGYAKIELENFDGAPQEFGILEDMEKAIALDSSLNWLYNTIGIVKSNLRGDVEGALEAYGTLIEGGIDDPAPYWNRADLKKRQKDFAGAIQDYREVINFYQKTGIGEYFALQSCMQIGACYVELGDYASAIQTLSEAIEMNEDYLLAYYKRGLYKLELKDQVGACEDWHRAKRYARVELKQYCKQ